MTTTEVQQTSEIRCACGSPVKKQIVGARCQGCCSQQGHEFELRKGEKLIICRFCGWRETQEWEF